MTNPEILAPAGGKEQLTAAVRCGADAVYLGTGDFNARRNAENFSGDELKEAVKYCHLRNVKVYVTLNTLVFDNEINNVYETVKAVADSGADAVLTDDFAVIKAVKDICPEMALHASTQMAVHNVSGALLLQSLGFSRVVLAREMSLEEISAVSECTTLETEVFVHGAHCMSASGNCYLSSILGERSGNRGLCAQGCRLNWKSHEREYALSLKDMSYLSHTAELKEAGVSSLKIEGRMKRPEYVAAAVTSLKKALCGEYFDEETLKSVFSRSGFTDGYLMNRRTVDMFGYRKKEDVISAAPVLKSLEQLYRADTPVTPVAMEFTLKKGEPCELTVKAKGEAVTVYGETGEQPQKSALTYELCERNLKKLGDTPFFLSSLVFNNPDSLTLSSASVNAVRRDAAEKLINKLSAINTRVNPTPSPTADFTPYSRTESPKIRVRLESFSQYSPLFNDCETIILGLDEILKNADEIKSIPAHFSAELPSLIYPGSENAVKEKLKKIKALGITDGTTGNLGGIRLLKSLGFTLHGAHGLNITNTVAIDEYEKLGVSDVTLSFELSKAKIKALGGRLSRAVYTYGYLPIMLFRCCPQKTARGCDSCDGHSFITDRKGIDFTVLCHNKEYSTLLNSVPLYAGDRAPENVDFFTLYFTTEEKSVCEEVYKAQIAQKPINGAKTNGLYFRELL